MEAGIKAGTGSREFRLSCPATSSHIDVVYPQHVARGIGGRGGVPCATKKFLVGQDRINSPDFLLPSPLPLSPLSSGDAEISRWTIDHRIVYVSEETNF